MTAVTDEVSVRERALVRDLARRVAAVALDEARMAPIRKRWCDVNGLRKPDRAPVWCRPVGCWSELVPEDSLACQTPDLRRLERHFRQVLVKRDIDDDDPVSAHYALPARFDCEPANSWGVPVGRHAPAGQGGAWAYDPPLKTAADFDRLRLPTFTYNEARTEADKAWLEDLFGDILPVRVVCGAPLGATLGTPAADLRGLEQIMMDAIAEPELLHRLMAHVRDGVLGALDQVESTGLVTTNTTGPMYESDPIGDSTGPSFTHCWCATNSQEFDQVSPAMWEEFCLNYQKPIMARFGLVGYGCCENLTHKIDGVLSIPNLRIFTCSAWTDLEAVLSRCGTDYCIMWRQKASDVVFPEDTETVARDLEEGCRRLQGHYYQIVLRELQTLSGHPRRLHEWARTAKEAAARWA